MTGEPPPLPPPLGGAPLLRPSLPNLWIDLSTGPLQPFLHSDLATALHVKCVAPAAETAATGSSWTTKTTTRMR